MAPPRVVVELDDCPSIWRMEMQGRGEGRKEGRKTPARRKERRQGYMRKEGI